MTAPATTGVADAAAPARIADAVDELAVAAPVRIADAVDELAVAALALARRLAAGATLWTVAPGAEHHARHVAVEFVHPVVVGARSFPAAVIESPDLVATARLLVRPGDVVLALGAADDPIVVDLLRRCSTWGAVSLLLAGGRRPATAPAADHVLWTAAPGGRDTILVYHLLWELTQVVFEHPGLLRAPSVECADDVCITCSDEGRVAEVRRLVDDHTVVAAVDGHHERVDVSVVGPVAPDDLLLVHAGLALAILGGQEQT